MPGRFGVEKALELLDELPEDFSELEFGENSDVDGDESDENDTGSCHLAYMNMVRHAGGEQDQGDAVFRDSILHTVDDLLPSNPATVSNPPVSVKRSRPSTSVPVAERDSSSESDGEWMPQGSRSVRGRKQAAQSCSRGKGRHCGGGHGHAGEQNLEWETFDGTEDNPAMLTNHFTARRGLSDWIIAREPKTASDYFHLFWDRDVTRHICHETNAYAESSRREGPSTMRWIPLDSVSLDAFIGVSIAQGLDRRAHLRDYWSVKPWSRTPWYGEVFTAKDFFQIHRYLHCCDNDAAEPNNPNRDKLFKVRYLVDKLSENFRLAYTPGQNISIDEQMIGTKCRVSFIQYMPKKPTKFGIKVWVLADSENGYCSRFEIYTGRVEGAVEIGLASRVVHTLSEDFRHMGYHLYFDNFYTSPNLCLELLQHGILSCGTVRVNRRGFPVELKPVARDRFAKGDMVFRKCQSLTAVRWKDKRDVTALSTIHGNRSETIPARKDEQSEGVTKPCMIVDYNKYMGGVDMLDQLLCYYTVGRRTMKWWKRVFWRLVELCIVNAYVLFKEATGSKMEQKTFREELVLQLTQEQHNQRTNSDLPDAARRGRPRSVAPDVEAPRCVARGPVPTVAFRTSGVHPMTTSRDGGKRRTCRVCGYERNDDGKKSQRKTNNFCSTCDKYIHAKDCWNIWHSVEYTG